MDFFPFFRLYDQVVVITHHRIGTDIDREHLGQEQNASFEPAAAMFEALARITVFAAQKGSADTA